MLPDISMYIQALLCSKMKIFRNMVSIFWCGIFCCLILVSQIYELNFADELNFCLKHHTPTITLKKPRPHNKRRRYSFITSSVCRCSTPPSLDFVPMSIFWECATLSLFLDIYYLLETLYCIKDVGV